jgi:hypothetical protein
LKSVILATTGCGEAKKADKLDKAMMNENQLQTDLDFWQLLIKGPPPSSDSWTLKNQHLR